MRGKQRYYGQGIDSRFYTVLYTEKFTEKICCGQTEIPTALYYSSESAGDYEYAAEYETERDYYANNVSVIKAFHTFTAVKTKYPITVRMTAPSRTQSILLKVFILLYRPYKPFTKMF